MLTLQNWHEFSKNINTSSWEHVGKLLSATVCSCMYISTIYQQRPKMPLTSGPKLIKDWLAQSGQVVWAICPPGLKDQQDCYQPKVQKTVYLIVCGCVIANGMGNSISVKALLMLKIHTVFITIYATIQTLPCLLQQDNVKPHWHAAWLAAWLLGKKCRNTKRCLPTVQTCSVVKMYDALWSTVSQQRMGHNYTF